ncbi:MAG: glycosyltransferase [Acidobacteriia bacterium]|nr:glycosyltransferase [Terriglobia bacterium]
MKFRSKITIVITTKDRWLELNATIEALGATGLRDIPLIIMDDGSPHPCPSRITQLPSCCSIYREPLSLGYIAQRNRLARFVTTEYLISLDDDSCFHDASKLEEAVEFCDRHPDVAVLRFRTIDGPVPLPAFEPETPDRGPRNTDTFVGCGYMARVSTFRQLGGFRSWFQAYGEEREYCMRVYNAGLRVVYFPAIVVHHRVSQSGRSSARRAFCVGQNALSTWALNLPQRRLLLGISRSVIGLLYLSVRKPGEMLPTLLGILSGCAQFWVHRKERCPMSKEAFVRWRNSQQWASASGEFAAVSHFATEPGHALRTSKCPE